MMKVVGTCEMLVNLYQSTQRYKPEGRHFHTHRKIAKTNYKLIQNKEMQNK
jgi:hypothetical protein